MTYNLKMTCVEMTCMGIKNEHPHVNSYISSNHESPLTKFYPTFVFG